MDTATDDTKIGPSVTVEGDFGGDGNVTIEGTVKGSVKTNKNLIITASAKVHASIEAQNCSISGEVRGNIKVLDTLEISSTANIIGDIVTRLLSISSGASINGNVTVGEQGHGNYDVRPEKQTQTTTIIKK